MNGFQQEGFGRMDMTVGGGRRASAANAYLRPAMRRPNLAVHTHSLATRVLFEGRRAVGVAYRRGNEEHVARARREVIVSAGPFNRRSSSSSRASGRRRSSRARHPGRSRPAGRRREPPGPSGVLFPDGGTQPVTLYSQTTLFRRALIGMRWLLTKDGLGASNHFETGGFIRSRAGIRYPNIQYHFLPMAVSYDGSSLAQEHGFQAHVGPMRSQSKGWVRLASADPSEKPKVFFDYLSRPEDREEMRACVRLTREIFAQPAFAPYRGREIQPGAAVQSDEQIDDFVRATCRERLSPLLHVQDGKPGRSAGRGRPGGAGDRVGGIAGRRLFDHAFDHHRESQRSHPHAGGEGGRPHPRQIAAAAGRCAVLCRPQLGNLSAVSAHHLPASPKRLAQRPEPLLVVPPLLEPVAIDGLAHLLGARGPDAALGLVEFEAGGLELEAAIVQ